MIRKILCTILAVAALIFLPVKAEASDLGSIRISLNVGDLAVTNGAFSVSRVGTRTSDGYRIAETYGGGFVRAEDALSPHLAQWMARGDEKNGRTVLLDADGNAYLSSLEEGLYLIKQVELTDGYYPIQPFLMSIPCEKRHDVIINLDPLPRVMESPPTGESAAPLFWTLILALSAGGLILCVGKRRLF